MTLYGLGVAAALIAASAPVFAQSENVVIGGEEVDASPEPDRVADVMAMMENVFAAKPLTPEQEQRLPLSSEVVAVMTPPGFYSEMMDDMMGSIIEPMFGILSGPLAAEQLLIERIGFTHDELPELTEKQSTRVIALLDPAAPRRVEAMTTSITKLLTDVYQQVEDPLREGFTKAFAARFTESQLRDLQAFFATPTGKMYAEEAFSIYVDPQVMTASMRMMPAMLESISDMSSEIEMAMARLPAPRAYEDLWAAERDELARLLGLSQRALRSSMKAANKMREK